MLNRSHQSDDEWRQYRRALRWRLGLLAVLIVVVAVVVTSLDGSGGGGLPAFNACIRQKRFLVLVRHRSPNGVIETIKDRALGTLEGEVADDRLPPVRNALSGQVVIPGQPPPILGGVGAGGGPYVMSTGSVVGQDANAIINCWDGPYPVAPGA